MPEEPPHEVRRGRVCASSTVSRWKNPWKTHGFSANSSNATLRTTCLVIGQYLDQLEQIREKNRGSPSSPARPLTTRRETLYNRVQVRGQSRCSSSRRWPTSPSTFPTPTLRSKSRAPTAPARRNRKRLGTRLATEDRRTTTPTSTPLSPRTPRIRNCARNRFAFSDRTGVSLSRHGLRGRTHEHRQFRNRPPIPARPPTSSCRLRRKLGPKSRKDAEISRRY